MGPIHTAAAPAAPLTFNGARFGRAVAGAQRLPARGPLHASGGRGGLVHGIARLGSVVRPPARSEDIDRPLAAVQAKLPPVRIHRKPVANTPARGTQRLTESDFESSFAPVQRLAETTPEPATSWTLENGFADGAQEAEANTAEGAEDAPPARTMRIRRRPEVVVGPPPDTDQQVEPDAPSDRADAQPDGVDGEAGVEIVDPDAGPPPPVRPRYLPSPAPRRVAVADSWVSAPPDVVAAVAAATGVDVGGTPIDRSPGTTDRARSIGAIAFAESGTVHLPSELGPLDEPVVRAVVAHELTHVAQQRTHGSDLPPEDSPAGQALEAEAQAVQRAIHSGAVVTPVFLRRLDVLDEAPPAVERGVQRLAHPEWAGQDWSELDLTEIEPGSDNDPFRWQEREGEPTGVEWETRREWAETFEEEHAEQLQSIRDDRYEELVAEAREPAAPGQSTEPGVPAGIQLTVEQVLVVRRQLDAELPYQFGPPQGVEPYPQPLPEIQIESQQPPPEVEVEVEGPQLPQEPGTTEAEAPQTGQQVVAPGPAAGAPPVVLPLPAPQAPPAVELLHRVPVLAPLPYATAATAARFDTATPAPGFTAQSPEPPTAPIDVTILPTAPAESGDRPPAAPADLAERRIERERELRRIVLTEKLIYANAAGQTEPVTLNEDEVSQIRLLVDVELPSGDPFPTYLDPDEDVSLSVDGEYGTALATVPVAEPATVTAFPDVTAGQPALSAPVLQPQLVDGSPTGVAHDPLAHPDLHSNPYASSDLAANVVDMLSEVDLEILTRKLYRRIRTHLRAELLTDRERAGSIADIR